MPLDLTEPQCRYDVGVKAKVVGILTPAQKNYIVAGVGVSIAALGYNLIKSRL